MQAKRFGYRCGVWDFLQVSNKEHLRSIGNAICICGHLYNKRKKMKNRGLLLVVLLSLLLSGCTKYYYCPNDVNVPLLTDKNQFHIDGSLGSSDFVNINNLQMSYSPLNHLGLIGNCATYSGSGGSGSEGSAHLLEIGAGYYYATQGRVKLVGDIYGGFGGGKMNSDVNMNFRRFFIQPGIGLRGRYFDLALSWRIVNVKYYNFDANGQTDDYLSSQNLIDYTGRRIDNGSYTFFEPCLTLRAGGRLLKFQFQLVGVNNIGYIPWNYETSEGSIGLCFNIEDMIERAADRDRKKHRNTGL